MNDIKVLGIIPARGGSKGIPRKNIKLLNDKPLIFYSIESAKKSLLDRVVVSTEDDEIAKVSKSYSVEVVKRPPQFALDNSPVEDAIIYTIEILNEKGYNPEAVVLLEPTSPLRKTESINKGIQLFLDNKDKFDSIISVVEDYSTFWTKKNEIFQRLFENQPRRRQERQPLYKETGVFYLIKTDVVLRKRLILGDCVLPFIVPEIESVDINNHLDFDIAEILIKKNTK